MHPIVMGAALAALWLPEMHAAQSASEAADTDVVDVRRSADRLTVPVKLGDNGPYHFLIDTGSQNTVVSSGLVSRLALKTHSRVKVIGVAGSEVVDAVQLEEVILGRRSYYGLLAPVLERGDLGAEGILGIDSLQDQRVLIDFRKGLMAVSDARSQGGDTGFEIVVTARRRSGQLIMTDARIDGVRVDVVIDTGSDFTLGNRALQLALGRRGQITTPNVMTSVTGQQIAADIGKARQLVMQGVSVTDVGIAYSDSPTFEYLKLSKRPAILLGMREMRVFPRIAIDFRARKVLFDLPDGGDPAYFGDTGEVSMPRGN